MSLRGPGLAPRGTDRALSREGSELTANVIESLESLWRTELVGRSVRARRMALEEAIQSSSTANWDGYGADPVKPLSVEWTGRLLEDLPTSIPIPEIGVAPDGDIVLEWFSDRGRVLSVSVGVGGEVRFSLRGPSSKFTGIEPYSDGIPPRLAEALAAVVS
jgi:hypothetical protein